MADLLEQTDMSKVNGAKYHAAPQYLVERILAAPYDTNKDGCRLWKGSIGRGGYGYAKYRVGGRKERLVYVHRLLYVRLVEDPGDEAEVDHSCHDPDLCTVPPDECPHRRCYELSHLEAVTGKENKRRSGSPFAVNGRKDRCDHGHLLAGDNLLILGDGTRGCRECQRLNAQKDRDLHRDEINARVRAKSHADRVAREHRCKVCGVDIHHRPAHSKFCELCTTDKPTRREAQRLASAGILL